MVRGGTSGYDAADRETEPHQGDTMGEFALGQPVARFEDQRLLRGGGRYVDDLQLPGMAFGVVVRSPHAHARIRAVDTEAARAAPGVLAVLTGADWDASGYGDLPVPRSGWKRRTGAPMYRPRYPAMQSGRVRWVGDPVAFVVAETRAQALDAADLVVVDYQPLPAVVATAGADGDGAPLVWDDCPNNICFNHEVGDKAATDAAFAKADHVVSHAFVISRVYAAAMEPRGAVGDYDPAEDRYTIHTTLQRAHTFRKELAETLNIAESKLRVVAGDVGGSFGNKSAVYNEVALVLFASKVLGRPVKWTATRSESFLADAGGRDNVSEVSLALDKEGHFLGMRVRNTVALGAYLQTGADSSPTGNLGTLAGVYRTPAIHVDVTDRVHQHQPDAALSRQRAARGGLPDRAHHRRCRRRARHRPRRAAPPQHHSARRHAVQDRADLRLRLRRVREEHGHGPCHGRLRRVRGAPGRRGQARQAARLRHLQFASSAPPRRATRWGRSVSTAPAPAPSCPAPSTRARGTRRSSSSSCATGSGSIPRT